MSDLTKIFTHRQSYPQKIVQPSLKYSTKFSSFKPSIGSPLKQYSTLPQNSPMITRDLQISTNARHVLSRSDNPNLHKEVSWFKQKFMLEGLIKIFITIAISFMLCSFFDLISFSSAISFIAVCSLSLALRHNIFSTSAESSDNSNNRIETWAFVSLLFSFLVFVNQVFMQIMYFVHFETASNLNHKNTSILISVLPAIHISLMLGIVFINNPLISPNPHRNLMENVLSIPSNIVYHLTKIFKIKYMLSQSYIFVILVTFILVNIFECGGSTPNGNMYNNGGINESTINRINTQSSSHLSNNFFNIVNLALNPAVFIAQFITFFTIYLFFNVIITILSDGISQILIKVNYDQKTEFSMIPYMLELLRVNPIDDYHSSKNNMSVSVANVFSFYPDNVHNHKKYSYGGDTSILFSRHKTEILYNHCLSWVLSALLAYNPQALNTKITTSRFYHTYADIIEEFSCKELQRCVHKLNQMQILLRNYQNQKEKKKSLFQDVFYPLRVFMKNVKLWFSGIECIRYLLMVDNILQILQTNKSDHSSPNIIRSLKELKQITDIMKSNMMLKEVMREKIKEYNNKCNRAYDSLSTPK